MPLLEESIDVTFYHRPSSLFEAEDVDDVTGVNGPIERKYDHSLRTVARIPWGVGSNWRRDLVVVHYEVPSLLACLNSDMRGSGKIRRYEVRTGVAFREVRNYGGRHYLS